MSAHTLSHCLNFPLLGRHGRSPYLFLNPNTASSFPRVVIQAPAHLLLCRPRQGCWPSAAPAPSFPPGSLQVWPASCWPRRGWFWTAGSAEPPRSAWPELGPRGCRLYHWDRSTERGSSLDLDSKKKAKALITDLSGLMIETNLEGNTTVKGWYRLQLFNPAHKETNEWFADWDRTTFSDSPFA